MSASAGPNIVKDGLVLCLDAGNRDSYPGTGTTWKDISYNNVNMTLVNGPTFDVGNNGSIILDGTNDYVTKSDLMMLGGPNKEITVEAVFYLPSGGGGYLISNERESSSNFHGHGIYTCTTSKLEFEQHSRPTIPYSYYATASNAGFSNIKINGWNIVSWAVNIGTTSMYVNYLINGYTETITNNSLVFQGVTTTEDNVDIGRWRNNGYVTTYANFKISNIKIYNRLLTIYEQKQNYEAMRGRFGL